MHAAASPPIPDELRAFFAEVRADPYGHLLVRHALDCWCAGYEAAIRRADKDGLAEATEEFRRGDLLRKAEEWLSEQRQESERQLVIALAQLGAAHLGAPRG